MTKTFTYIHSGKLVKLEYDIPEYTFKKYNGYWKVFPRGIVYFVPWMKRVVYTSRRCPEVQKIIYNMKMLISGWSKEEQLEFILLFCRSFKYQSDTNLYKIFDYWATAQETLYKGQGDCEDFSILLCTFLLEFGYNVKLVWMKDHMACAIAGNYSGYYLESGGTKYYYVESVSKREIGNISDENKAKTKILINAA